MPLPLVLLIATDERLATVTRRACAALEVDFDRVDDATAIGDRRPTLVICDFAASEQLRRERPGTNILLHASAADSAQAIMSIKHGAIDYLVAPVSPEAMEHHLREALGVASDRAMPGRRTRREDSVVDEMVGQSPAMKEVYKRIGLIAPRDINVLISGESGTGKELVAQAILNHSRRADRTFLAVNCAAIPETLLESELFGHEKGAFTGADARRIGKFEQCHGGTLFLDEIGDIPLATQAKLLRVLQDNSFQRLGGSETVVCDVRIIAATHQPLEQLIEERRFRQDLYYRLNVATIHVPPLREREVDVVLLAHAFVAHYNRVFGTDIRSFSPESLPVLLGYPWPGNVRELENAIKSALVVARGAVFRPEFLPAAIREYGTVPGQPGAGPGVPRTPEAPSSAVLGHLASELADRPDLDGALHATALAMVEREVIRAALVRGRGRIAVAARHLGITRATLRRRMDALGVTVDTTIRAADDETAP